MQNRTHDSSNDIQKNKQALSRLVVAGLFAALAVALNYALIAVPQVKLFNLIVFSAGYFGGIYAGALSGGIAAAVYSIFNPYNMGMFPPIPLLASQVFCMALIGAVGGACRKFNFLSGTGFLRTTKAALLGFLSSLLYNVVVTAAGAYLFGAFKEAFIAGIPFMLVNIGANVVIFAVLLPLMVPLDKRFRY